MHRTVFYLFCARCDNPVFHALIEQAKPYPHYDLKNCLRFFADSKKNLNHYRVQRLYCLLKLNFHRKEKQLFPMHKSVSLATPVTIPSV